MNSNKFKSGDILIATHREIGKGWHPIVYLGGFSEDSFLGAMLTHDSNPKRNLKIESSYFKKKAGYEHTYLVLGRFIKPEEWGPFKKVNELSAVGLTFLLKRYLLTGLKKLLPTIFVSTPSELSIANN